MTARRKLALGAVCALAMGGQAMAQDDYATPPSRNYVDTLYYPDFSGIWYPDWSRLFADRAAEPQLTPEAQEEYDAYLRSIEANGPSQEAQALCLPPGIPGVMQQPYPIEFIYSPGRVTILTEAYQQVRRIYTDGRPLPEDPDLFFNGNSVGFWSGDVLVVDTVGLNPRTNIAPGIPHTEASHVHEHIYKTGPEEIVIEYTITNPEVLAEPFVTRVAYRLDNEFPMREYVCAENNRLMSGEEGANVDLGFDVLDEPED